VIVSVWEVIKSLLGTLDGVAFGVQFDEAVRNKDVGDEGGFYEVGVKDFAGAEVSSCNVLRQQICTAL